MAKRLVTPEFLESLVELARTAGAAIMAVYNRQDGFDVTHKSDQSPLTEADLAAHQLIAQGLPELLSLPILSEEDDLPAFCERQQWGSYWLVDPLDGTKEFIARNGEFTVNIALIHNSRPVLGVVHVPATDTTYLGLVDATNTAAAGAWKYTSGQNPQPIQVRSLIERYQRKLPLTLLLSHRHGTQANDDLLALLKTKWPGELETTNAGSSLKFCVIAEGLADFYPRLAPTSEWDTAAAQAVLEAAGGCVVEATGVLTPLAYNTTEDILNPYFYALGDKHFCWEELLSSNSEC